MHLMDSHPRMHIHRGAHRCVPDACIEFSFLLSYRFGSPRPKEYFARVEQNHNLLYFVNLFTRHTKFHALLNTSSPGAAQKFYSQPMFGAANKYSIPLNQRYIKRNTATHLSFCFYFQPKKQKIKIKAEPSNMIRKILKLEILPHFFDACALGTYFHHSLC